MKLNIVLYGSIIMMYVLQRFVFARLPSPLAIYIIPGLAVVLWFVALFKYHAYGSISSYLALAGTLLLLMLATDAHADSENGEKQDS